MSEPGRVLIADGSAVSRHVAAAMVEHLGCRPTVVADGSAAVREATSGAFELVLLSLGLPVFDGAEALRQIRALERGPRTPSLAMASAGDARARGADFDGFLTLPLTLQAMRAALGRWTGLASLERPALDGAVVSAVTKLGTDVGEDLWGRLVGVFLAEAGSWIPAMRAASSKSDAEAMFRSAHNLTGSSANLGASHLAALCSTLAQDRVLEDVVATSAAVDSVEVELERVVAALRSSVG